MLVENLATPEASVPVPSVVAPSRKVTDPAGAAAPAPVSVAVKLSETPTVTGEIRGERLMPGVALLTVMVRETEVAAA